MMLGDMPSWQRIQFGQTNPWWVQLRSWMNMCGLVLVGQCAPWPAISGSVFSGAAGRGGEPELTSLV
jgi:hypothetical protein